MKTQDILDPFGLSKTLKNVSNQDHPRKFLAVYIGFALIIVFLGFLSLVPQVSEKLGELAVKKQSQQSFAQVPDSEIGTAVSQLPQEGISPTAVVSGGVTEINVDPEIVQLLNLVNDYRQQNGLIALKAEVTLTNIAQWYANDMATDNYWSDEAFCSQFGMGPHCDNTPRTWTDRMNDFGYDHNTWKAENLAVGYTTAQAVFDHWRTSSGHNNNMLSPDFTAIGMSFAYNTDSDFGYYWVQEFGGDVADEAKYTSTPPPPPTPHRSSPCGNMGDVNGDGWITIDDQSDILTRALEIIREGEEITSPLPKLKEEYEDLAKQIIKKTSISVERSL